MVAAAANPFVIGLYTPAEAARLVRSTPEAVARWVMGDERRTPVIKAELGRSRTKVLTFRDLIQSRAIREIRFRTVPLVRIREAISVAQRSYGVEHPLSYKHRLFSLGKSILLELESRDLVQITKPNRHQYVMKLMVQTYMDEIKFDDQGRARRWTLLREGELSIDVDPKIRLGQPVVTPGDILADALADAAVSEGSIEAAADAYETRPEAVRLALRYQQQFSGLVA